MKISLSFHPDVFPGPVEAPVPPDPKEQILSYLRSEPESRLAVTIGTKFGRSTTSARHLLNQLIESGDVVKSYAPDATNRSAYYTVADKNREGTSQ